MLLPFILMEDCWMGGGEKKGYDRIVLLSMIENVILGDSFPAYICWLILRQYGLGEAVRFAATIRKNYRRTPYSLLCGRSWWSFNMISISSIVNFLSFPSFASLEFGGTVNHFICPPPSSLPEWVQEIPIHTLTYHTTLHTEAYHSLVTVFLPVQFYRIP